MPTFRYVRTVLEGILGLFLRYGIALEAHGQNLMLVFSDQRGYKYAHAYMHSHSQTISLSLYVMHILARTRSC